MTARRRARARAQGQTTAAGYGADHRRARALLLAGDPPCWQCGQPATHADHVPPLDYTARTLGLTRLEAAGIYTIDGTGTYQLRPACARCNLSDGARYALAKQGRTSSTPTTSSRPLLLGASRTWALAALLTLGAAATMLALINAAAR